MKLEKKLPGGIRRIIRQKKNGYNILKKRHFHMRKEAQELFC